MGLKLADGRRVAASLMLYDADRMSPEGRRNVALWLRRLASLLERAGGDYSPQFRARYTYDDAELPQRRKHDDA